jgi:hypothetical protein
VNRPGQRLTPRGLLATTALLAMSIGFALALTQCKMVTDTLATAQPAGTDDAANCAATCAHQYNDSMRVESELHVQNVHDSKGDPGALVKESTRHVEAVNRIQDGRKQCQDQCHHQGGGKGGH